MAELTVITVPESSVIDVPGIFIPAVFHFRDGRYSSHTVGRLEDLPQSHIEKYCPTRN
jgi:hypothetical protein